MTIASMSSEISCSSRSGTLAMAIRDDFEVTSRRQSDARLSELARRFCDALRAADGRGAEAIAGGALNDGLTIAGVHARVIAPAMHQIGELWEHNAISVADEHLATAIAHRVIAALYMTNDIGAPGTKETVVLAAPAGQHHGLGLRMAADVLETAGYVVVYLGTDVPIQALEAIVAEHQPAVVGLSLTMALGAHAGEEAQAAVKRASPDTHVLFGGQGVPDGWIEDGVSYVATVELLLAEVRRLIGSRGREVAIEVGAPPRRGEHVLRDVTVGVGTTEDHMLDAAIEMGQLVRDQARLTAQFRSMAFQDHLTGLPNRRAFDDRFAELAASETAGSLALVLLDVDKFKQINDQFGHDEGDEALRVVADALRGRLRASDLPARLGGDEFAVLLPAMQRGVARSLAMELQRCISDRCQRTQLTVSIGIAWFAGDRRRTILRADQALYRAKSHGGNHVSLSDPDHALAAARSV